MLLTQKLLGYLNRVFNKDPARVMALSFNHAYPMSWVVQDGVLTTTVPDNPGQFNLSINLIDYTFAELVNYIAAQPGYITPYMAPSMADISSAALMDAAGSVTPSDPPQPLYAFTSVLWAYLDANAAELELASQQIANLPAEMSTTTADTIWLDTLGSYYNVKRLPNEEDSAYGPRIIASVLRPMGNNVAMEIAISMFTGQDTTVTDVEIPGVTGHSFNGAQTFDGAIEYNSVYTPIYGLFDVQYGYDLLNGQDPTTFAQTITALINTLRDAGTHLRDLSLVGSALTDSLTPPTDGPLNLTLNVEAFIDDDLTPPSDSSSHISIQMVGMADTLTTPSDASGMELTINYAYKFNGIRTYNGVIAYESGITEVDTF